MSDTWGANVPISMPTPPSLKEPGLVNIGQGFVFTAGGIFPDLNMDEFDRYVTPTFSPSVIEGET